MNEETWMLTVWKLRRCVESNNHKHVMLQCNLVFSKIHPYTQQILHKSCMKLWLFLSNHGLFQIRNWAIENSLQCLGTRLREINTEHTFHNPLANSGAMKEGAWLSLFWGFLMAGNQSFKSETGLFKSSCKCLFLANPSTHTMSWSLIMPCRVRFSVDCILNPKQLHGHTSPPE
jgi:hypothetical protein